MARCSVALAVAVLASAAWAAGAANDSKVIGGLRLSDFSKPKPMIAAFEVKDIQFMEASCADTTERVVVCTGLIVPKTTAINYDVKIDVRVGSLQIGNAFRCAAGNDRIFSAALYFPTATPQRFWAVNDKAEWHPTFQDHYMVSIIAVEHQRATTDKTPASSPGSVRPSSRP